MKTFEPHESQVCEMYSIFEIHLQNNLSDDQVGICFPQFDHTHAMLASSWLSVHYSWLLQDLIHDSNPDLTQDLNMDLTLNLTLDLIPDLILDLIPNFISDRFHG